MTEILYLMSSGGDTYPWGGSGFQPFTPSVDVTVSSVRVHGEDTARLYGPTGAVLAEWVPVGSSTWEYVEPVVLDTPVTLTAGSTYGVWADSQRYFLTFEVTEEGYGTADTAPMDGAWPGSVADDSYRMPFSLFGEVTPVTYQYTPVPLVTEHYPAWHPYWFATQDRGLTLLREDGVWVMVDSPMDDRVSAAERAYRGGYVYELSESEYNEIPTVYGGPEGEPT